MTNPMHPRDRAVPINRATFPPVYGSSARASGSVGITTGSCCCSPGPSPGDRGSPPGGITTGSSGSLGKPPPPPPPPPPSTPTPTPTPTPPTDEPTPPPTEPPVTPPEDEGEVLGERDDADIAGVVDKLPQTGGVSTTTLLGLVGILLVLSGVITAVSAKLFRKRRQR